MALTRVWGVAGSGVLFVGAGTDDDDARCIVFPDWDSDGTNIKIQRHKFDIVEQIVDEPIADFRDYSNAVIVASQSNYDVLKYFAEQKAL